MPAGNDLIESVGSLVKELEKAGLDPTLVGGMALVLLGSQRVTRDFDFLLSGNEAAATLGLSMVLKTSPLSLSLEINSNP